MTLVKSNFEPPVDSINNRAVWGEPLEADSVVDFRGSGVVVGNVKNDSFLGDEKPGIRGSV